MIYREFSPSPSLARFVRCYWILEGDSADETPERILPDGQTEIIFHFAEPFRRMENGRPVSQNRSVITGQLRSHIMLQTSGKSGIAAIRFLPFGAFPFLHIPMSELTNTLVAAELILGNEAGRMEERIALAPTHADKIGVLEDFLSQRLEAHRDNAILQKAVYNVRRQQEALTKDALLKDIGLSLRQLERHFQREVGLSPRSLSRIFRLQRGLRLWESGTITSLTELALESGYYDQSHFTNDFRDFAGISPGAFLAERRQFADNFILEG